MEHIRKSLGAFIKNSNIKKGIEQNKALLVWPEVVGEKIAENSEAQSVDSGVILVRTKTPVWRQELQLQKYQIINKINKALTKEIIKDIRFL